MDRRVAFPIRFGSSLTDKTQRRGTGPFDIMFDAAPQAFAAIAEFILRHTSGRCGNQQIFDQGLLSQLATGTTTMQDAQHLLGACRWIHCVLYDGEVFTFRGAKTRFKMPARVRARGRVGTVLTHERNLRIDFGPDEVARRITVEDSEYLSPPRL
jgi:hypothetical protein